MDWQPVGVVGDETGMEPRGAREDCSVMASGPAERGKARALWYEAPGRADLRDAALREPGSGEALVRTLFSAISRGTERLVFEGRVPASERERMRAPLQEGDFPFPVKYGYCAVGRVEARPADWLGRSVFALHPHQNAFVAPLDLLTLVPEGVPPRRAVLAANAETALNALWDAGAGPCDRVSVIGGGVVGLLAGWLAARLPGANVTVVDTDPSRRHVAEALGLRFAHPADAPGECDLVLHASGTAAGLEVAIASAGMEATVVELSWYGEGHVAVPLGGAFHARRLHLLSSQVGQVAPSRRPRWTHARRRAAALGLLADDRLDVLLTGELAFQDLPAALPRLLAPGAPGLCTVIRY
jgi:2-desacetyl-2-hydroxyethyl bacteriochlorophyllide A dehydrogenase